MGKMFKTNVEREQQMLVRTNRDGLKSTNQPKDDDTPPPTPEAGQNPASPLNVTVLSPPHSPSDMSVGTEMSDLTNHFHYNKPSRDTGIVDPSSPAIVEADESTLTAYNCNRGAETIMEDLMGMMNMHCSQPAVVSKCTSIPECKAMPDTQPDTEWRPPVWGMAPTFDNTVTEAEGAPLSQRVNNSTEGHHENFELVLEERQKHLKFSPKGSPAGSAWNRQFKTQTDTASVMENAVMSMYSDIDKSIAEETEEASVNMDRKLRSASRADQDKEENYGIELESPLTQAIKKPKKKKWTKRLAKRLSLQQACKKQKNIKKEKYLAKRERSISVEEPAQEEAQRTRLATSVAVELAKHDDYQQEENKLSKIGLKAKEDELLGEELVEEEETGEKIKRFFFGSTTSKAGDPPIYSPNLSKTSIESKDPPSNKIVEDESSASAPTKVELRSPPALAKPQWKGTVDPTSGKTYYYHRLSRITTWSKPKTYDEDVATYNESKKKKAPVLVFEKAETGGRVDATEQEVSIILENPKDPKTPFDEPWDEVESQQQEEEDDETESDGLVEMSAGKSLSNRVKSYSTIQTGFTESTPQIRNTGSSLAGSKFGPIPEAVLQGRDGGMSDANSVLTEHESSKDLKQVSGKPPLSIRSRELRVEEFPSSSRFSDKRFGLKPEEYAMKGGPVRVGRPSSQDPLDLLPRDDANRQDQFDLLQRKALDDAIKNNDWELATSVAEGMRGKDTTFGQDAEQDTSLERYTEWTQSEVDQFISHNDWDAVSQYIAQMRNAMVSGLSGSPNVPSSGNSAALSEPSLRVRSGNNVESHHRIEAKKRIGSRSQLQHDKLDSVASTNDNIYRTDSYEASEFASSDTDSSYEYTNPSSRYRRQAT